MQTGLQFPWSRGHKLLTTQIHTVGVGVAIGQSCMLLSAGTKGKRFMLPHATGKHALVSC